MRKITSLIGLGISFLLNANAQTIRWEGREFSCSHVKTSFVLLNGDSVLKIERDLNSLPFDTARLEATVDEPTFVKVRDLNLASGTIEVKVLSRLQNPSPFEQAQGFIGIAYRINEDNTAYESIYLRPKVGRSENQFARNHSVQYYAYPDYKFQRLRKDEFRGQYETYADISLNEWITIRIELEAKRAKMYLNNQAYPSFIVNEPRGKSQSGSVGLWVDIGTEGYFKDFKVTEK